jgi:hypothetical protein
MKRIITALALTLLAAPALAQEPRGCDKFKWKLDAEHALLRSPAAAKIRSGEALDRLPATALAVSLVPSAAANMPMPPERAPKVPASFAGFVRVGALPGAGAYRVTLSAEGWIDVVQGGRYVKSGGSSGVQGCEGMRKSVRFNLAAEPFVVQVSGAESDTITMTITPAAE